MIWNLDYFDNEHLAMIANWKAQQDPFDTLGQEVSPTITTRVGAFCSSMVLTADCEIVRERELKMKIKEIEGKATEEVVARILEDD